MSPLDESAKELARKEQRQRDYERFLTLQARFEGAQALYREGMGISLVRVGLLKPTPERFIAGIDLIPTRGLYNARPECWPVSATWEIFGFTHNHWACGHLSLTACFEPDVIEAVIAQAAVVEPEEYTRERKGEIWEWMRESRKSRLAKHRLQTLTLTWNGAKVAELTDHWLSDYPEVNSRVDFETLAPDVRVALADYSAWWKSDDDRDSPTSPFGEALFVGWEVVTPCGKHFHASIPKFDFAVARVDWRCGDLTAE